MDKFKIIEIAMDMAADDGVEYDDLSPGGQMSYYKKAYEDYLDRLADRADMMRKGEADGGMMRKNYAVGSEEDIPEIEEMPSDEYLDLLKSVGADKEQASGIKSIKNKTASMDENEQVFMKLVDDFMERGFSLQEAIEAAKEEFENKSSRRKAPSIKMAGGYDPILVEEYEKYSYDMIEQGREPMPMDDFIRMMIDEARMGVRSGGITSVM